MIDFLMIATRSKKRGVIEIYPKFIIKKSSDLMIRGGDFYAIWVEEKKLWSTDEQDALRIIDNELDNFAKNYSNHSDSDIKVLHMWDAESGMIDSWHKYCQKQMRDSFHMLDENLIFSNVESQKTDYASKRLEYPLQEGSIEAYNEIVSTLYSEDERRKIEWAIGSIISGESKKIQKFMVLYGAMGTGKSTILNIIEKLFKGYYAAFDAKSLGASNSSFALEPFKDNPLVAIQHDGDLSRIEDNTRLNSLVSHELMTVNEKFKSTYTNRFKCFMFMGTNKPVKITDAKSGLIRRLIDVSPSGDKIPKHKYDTLMKQVDFELGAIAYHCLQVFLDEPNYYDNYIPLNMLGASNDFYNFILDSFHIFEKEDGTTLKAAWEMYKQYCEDAKVGFPFSQRIFKEELKNYFENYHERITLENNVRARSYYSEFKSEKFQDIRINNKECGKPLIIFNSTESIFDSECSDCPAQYANSTGTPNKRWNDVDTKLSDLDTTKLHYVKVPINHIVIDFDISDENGNKSLERNLKEASKWPKTYAELSKSGKGVHLHYIYQGDPLKLSSIYDDHIEIKVFKGNSSLRRKFTKCNEEKIAYISSGLPLKGDEVMINGDILKSEKSLRNLICRNLKKDIHPGTKPSVDFIFKILEDAYNSDLKYDVSDMRNSILSFAANSTHQSDYCIKLVNKMHFKSEEPSVNTDNSDSKIVFYDIEVFPNLFIVNWKLEGKGHSVVRMINPSPTEIEELIKFKLVGFNCRRYDNHILYARLMGYTNEQLYKLSQKIINGSPNCFFGEAYNISYTDVYDFSSKKQSLKKFEIELGIHHQELGLPWDKPVPEELWEKVAEYCDNDVIATEAVFNDRKADFTARQILADVAGMTVNDTTNSLTTRIIFGKNRKPQDKFNYRFMGDLPNKDELCNFTITPDLTMYNRVGDDEYTIFDTSGKPYFPGYIFENGKSTYRGEEVGEGGYVYAEPGMYGNVALLDIASMHPSSIVAEQLFGEEYTKRFEEILNARIAIKHEDFDKAKKMLNGALAKYLTDKETASDLAQALKIAINSVYGLTSATFNNPFKDNRNKDNIVAKRGALFMINLKHEVKKRGFIVAHVKTDSIKIPDATPEIISFVTDYGKQYGYNFEHEATYDRMCLVNDAVYIAKYADIDKCDNLYGESYVNKSRDTLKDNKKHPNTWTATGTQFQVPYVFKMLFSKEKIEFKDMCETKSVNSTLYLDMNEDLEDVSLYEKEHSVLWKKISDNKNIKNDMTEECNRIEELTSIIEKGHNYVFVGKVGSFCPIKDGCGGGILLREKDGKYYAVTGTKGYRWMESEMVQQLKKQKQIDKEYYNKMVDKAIEAISEHGDFEWFISNDPYEGPKIVGDKPLYFDEVTY